MVFCIADHPGNTVVIDMMSMMNQGMFNSGPPQIYPSPQPQQSANGHSRSSQPSKPILAAPSYPSTPLPSTPAHASVKETNHDIVDSHAQSEPLDGGDITVEDMEPIEQEMTDIEKLAMEIQMYFKHPGETAV